MLNILIKKIEGQWKLLEMIVNHTVLYMVTISEVYVSIQTHPAIYIKYVQIFWYTNHTLIKIFF